MKKYRNSGAQVARGRFAAACRGSGRQRPWTLPRVVVETPPQPEMGDIAFPMFPFARAFRKGASRSSRRKWRRRDSSPSARERGPGGGGRARTSTCGSRPAPVIDDILHDIASQGAGVRERARELAGRRVMLEFSCPNTNKPLHLGHLRNDAIGESLSRILLAAGATLRKVNLINDRGVHICKSMLAYQMFGGSATPEVEGMKGDHFVGDYYVKYAQYAKDHPEAEEQVREMLRKWEEGDPEVVALWRKMNGWVIGGIEESYRRTGVSFDKVYFESDLYKLGRAGGPRGHREGDFPEGPRRLGVGGPYG